MYHFFKKYQQRCTLAVLALDAVIQKGRFQVQWLEGAQERKLESGIPQNAANEGPRDEEFVLQASSEPVNTH